MNSEGLFDIMLKEARMPDYRLSLTINTAYEYELFDITGILITRCRFEEECLPRIPKVTVLGPYHTRTKIEESLSDLADGCDLGRAIIVYKDDDKIRLLAAETKNGYVKSVELINSPAINCGLNSAEKDQLLEKLNPLPFETTEFVGPYANREAKPHDCPIYMIEDAMYRFYNRPLMDAPEIRKMHAFIFTRYNREAAILMSTIQDQLPKNQQCMLKYFDGAVDMWSQEVLPVWPRTPDIFNTVQGMVWRLMDDVDEPVRVNVIGCYGKYEQYVITNLRVEEEANRVKDSMNGVIVVPAVYIKQPIGTDDSYQMLSKFISSNVPKNGCKYKLLIPIHHVRHSIGLMLVTDNAVIQHAVLVDSSGAIEQTPELKSNIEEWLQHVFGIHGSEKTYLTWQQGYEQTGPACTVFTIENLIRAAKGKTTILPYGRCQILIRAHHAHLIRKAAFRLPTRLGRDGKWVNAYKYFIDSQDIRTADKEIIRIDKEVNYHPLSSRRADLWDHPSHGAIISNVITPCIDINTKDRSTSVLLVAAALDGRNALPELCNYLTNNPRMDIPIIDSNAVLAGLKDISDGSYTYEAHMHEHDMFLKLLLASLLNTQSTPMVETRIEVLKKGASDVFNMALDTIRSMEWLAEYTMEMFSTKLHGKVWNSILKESAPKRTEWESWNTKNDLDTVPNARFKRLGKVEDTDEETITEANLFTNGRRTNMKYTPLKRPRLFRDEP